MLFYCGECAVVIAHDAEAFAERAAVVACRGSFVEVVDEHVVDVYVTARML